MKTLQLTLGLLILTAVSHAQIITDPKQDFLARLEPVSGDTYKKLEADFNNDGKMDVAYTAASLHNDQALGEFHGWDVYLGVEGGFRLCPPKDADGLPRPEQMAIFRKDRYWLGIIPELNQFGLLTLHEGGVKQKGKLKAQLQALLFDADGVRTVDIGSPTTDIESLKRRFPKVLTPAVQDVAP